jgi:hypothetical protein
MRIFLSILLCCFNIGRMVQRLGGGGAYFYEFGWFVRIHAIRAERCDVQQKLANQVMLDVSQ